jgi:beta-N-acetylhexosaminidase
MQSPVKSDRNKYFFRLTGADSLWVENTLKNLSVKEKAAQLIIPWAMGSFTNSRSREYERLVKLVREQKVGGLIFFKGDIINEALLINKMQELSDIPLLIGSDFERGLGMRLTDGIEFPYNMAVAAAGDTNLAYKMGNAVAEECRAIGVHQNYAPVADINNNPENPIINIRSFSSDKNIVTDFSTAFLRGLNDGRVLSTSKHFPGHGNTRIDSHKEMPRIIGSRHEVFNNELLPFINDINSGVASVMLGHLNVPALEGKSPLPASISKEVVTNILKRELGFNGLVVTDAMNMNAVTKYYSASEAAVMAIKAGVDLILMPPDAGIAINAICNAVNSGEISEERLNESVRKLLAAKCWLRIERNRYSDLNNITGVVRSPEHIALAEEIAKKSITLVKDEKKLLLNLAKQKNVTIITMYEGYNPESAKEFSSLYEHEYGAAGKFYLSPVVSSSIYRKALLAASKSDLVIIPAFIKAKAFQGTVSLSRKNASFINKLLKVNKKIIVLSFGSPYLLSAFPEISTYLCAYGDVPVSQRAMLNAIEGKQNITGRLPVSIPNTKYTVGHGIILSAYALK